MKIINTNGASKGAFEAFEGEQKAGEMTYVWAGTDKIIIDHTGVEPAFKGRSVGKQLFQAAVDFAREKQIRVVPLCPFAKALFDKMPEHRDLLS